MNLDNVYSISYFYRLDICNLLHFKSSVTNLHIDRPYFCDMQTQKVVCLKVKGLNVDASS
jgi:hypothetical protein